ncbi:MAG: hypothetical protein ABWY71_00140 [Candidatus Saccharimonadales bacterium]
MMAIPGNAKAAGNDFDIQVSPSPLVVTLMPGKEQAVSLTIRNLSNHPETLYPKLNGFTLDKNSRNIQLQESASADMNSWVVFKNSSITIAPGATQPVDVVFHTPKEVGFSYSFALTLSRNANDTSIQRDGVTLKGAVAVFCLINIDRADAKRELRIAGFSGNKSSYQYLPADFTLQVENRGNIIDQPKGTLYIQRTFDSAKPIKTYSINSANNYVLPGTTREYKMSWDDGFPSYKTDANGKRSLSWDWKRVSDLRFGRYVAKTVIVYNDGQRDVPLVSSFTFWVIPWTLLLGMLLILIILVMGVVGWGRLIVRGTKKVRGHGYRR